MMLRRCLPIALVLLSLLACSCGEKKSLPPGAFTLRADSVIPEEQMIRILADVHIIESALTIERNYGRKTDNTAGYYQGVFKKYRISRQLFDANLKYYRQRPELMMKMYDSVTARLAAAQKRVKTP